MEKIQVHMDERKGFDIIGGIGGMRMIPEHYEYEIGINAYRMSGELSVLFSGYGRPEGRHRIGPAVHDYYLIHTALSGSGSFMCKGKQYKCNSGDTFVIVPGELFAYEADANDPWSYAWVGFNGSMAGDMLRTIGVTPDRPIVNGAGERIRGYYESMRKALQSEEQHRLADLESSGYLRTLLAELGKKRQERIGGEEVRMSDSEKRMRYAAGYLNTQYSQHISIEALSGELGYHRVYFSNLFKRFTGKSPKQYLVDVRMEQAEHLLLSTALSVEQIAGSVGYGDSLYFSKHFQRWSGKAPTAYRKTNWISLKDQKEE